MSLDIEASALGRLAFKAFEAGHLTSASLWRHMKVAVSPACDRSARRLWRSVVESLRDDDRSRFSTSDNQGWRELEHSIQACDLLAEQVAKAGLKPGKEKAEKTGRRGRPKVADERRRQAVLKMYHARPKGTTQKQFCEKQRLDHLVLECWLTWERIDNLRKRRKTDQANKTPSSRR